MMKKILILLYTILMPISSCYAVEWFEYAYKSYIDTSSIEYNGSYKRAWFKLLNDGYMEPINNQKIWYQMQYIYANCSTDEIATQDVSIYGLSGQVLDYYNVPYSLLNFYHTAPETVGRNKHDALCSKY